MNKLMSGFAVILMVSAFNGPAKAEDYSKYNRYNFTKPYKTGNSEKNPMFWITNSLGAWTTGLSKADRHCDNDYTTEVIELKAGLKFEIYCMTDKGARKNLYQGAYYIGDFGMLELNIKQKRDYHDVSWTDFNRRIRGTFTRNVIKMPCPKDSPLCSGAGFSSDSLTVDWAALEGCCGNDGKKRVYSR